MSKAIDNLTEAMKRAEAIRSRVGGFPYFAEVLWQAGVTRNVWSLPSCQSLFFCPGTELFHTGPDALLQVCNDPIRYACVECRPHVSRCSLPCSPLWARVNSEPPRANKTGAQRRIVIERQKANTEAKRMKRAAPLTGRRTRLKVSVNTVGSDRHAGSGYREDRPQFAELGCYGTKCVRLRKEPAAPAFAQSIRTSPTKGRKKYPRSQASFMSGSSSSDTSSISESRQTRRRSLEATTDQFLSCHPAQ